MFCTHIGTQSSSAYPFYRYRTGHARTSVRCWVHVVVLDLTVGSVLRAISTSTAMPRESWRALRAIVGLSRAALALQQWVHHRTAMSRAAMLPWSAASVLWSPSHSNTTLGWCTRSSRSCWYPCRRRRPRRRRDMPSTRRRTHGQGREARGWPWVRTSVTGGRAVLGEKSLKPFCLFQKWLKCAESCLLERDKIMKFCV